VNTLEKRLKTRCRKKGGESFMDSEGLKVKREGRRTGPPEKSHRGDPEILHNKKKKGKRGKERDS